MIKQKELSIMQLILITIIPSAISTVLYIGVGMYIQNIPSLALLFVIVMLTLFPFEMWVILSANKKEFGKYGLQIAFLNYEKMEWWKIILYGFALFGFAGVMSATVAPIESWFLKDLSDKLYSLLPAYFDWNNFELMKQYPNGILIFTSVFYIVMNVLILPLIEEVYFRGYLTNKLKRYGLLAPIIVAIVFSFYHWWLPFNNVFRIFIFGVAAVIAYKKKNIFISIVFHCLCNLLSSISFIIALLN